MSMTYIITRATNYAQIQIQKYYKIKNVRASLLTH